MRFVRKKLIRSFIKEESKIHKLRYLFWECTQRCNLSCMHCGSACIKESQYPDMPIENFLKVLDDINSYSHEMITVNITGGEPLLRNDLEKCGYEIRKRGFRWSIVTNGFAYTIDRHISLMNAGMGAATLSLDGLEENHNWLRKHPESFNRALEAMRLLNREKRLNFDVVTCVNQRNIKELESLYQFLKQEGLKAWRLFTIAPIGRASNHSELTLSGEQIQYLWSFIAQKRKESTMEINFSCEAWAGKLDHKIRDGFFFCRAGIHIGSVLIDGSIGACPNIDRAFVQGNIYTDHFMEVWNNKFNLYRDRSWMQKGICCSCEGLKDCQGGAFHLRKPGCEDPIMCHYKGLRTKD